MTKIGDIYFYKYKNACKRIKHVSKTCFNELIWNCYLCFSWMDIQKNTFWVNNCLGTHTARAVSKHVWVWNWARKSMTISFTNRELYSKEHVLIFSVSKGFSLNFLLTIHQQDHALKINSQTFKFTINLRTWVTNENKWA